MLIQRKEKDVNRSFDRTRLTTFKNDVEMVDSTGTCTLEALANIASEIHDSSSDDIDLITTETLGDTASSNMDESCNSKGSSVVVVCYRFDSLRIACNEITLIRYPL